MIVVINLIEKEIGPNKRITDFFIKSSKSAQISFILSLLLVAETLVAGFLFLPLGALYNQIPFTILLCLAILLGIVGFILAVFSFKYKVAVIGIIGLSIDLIAFLLNAWMLFVLHNNAGFAKPWNLNFLLFLFNFFSYSLQLLFY